MTQHFFFGCPLDRNKMIIISVHFKKIKKLIQSHHTVYFLPCAQRSQLLGMKNDRQKSRRRDNILPTHNVFCFICFIYLLNCGQFASHHKSYFYKIDFEQKFNSISLSFNSKPYRNYEFYLMQVDLEMALKYLNTQKERWGLIQIRVS